MSRPPVIEKIRAEELYGWAEEEALGRNVVDVTPTEASKEQAAEIMAHLRNGERWKGEFPVRRRDGSTFPAIVSNTPLQDEDGNLTAIIGVTTDITGRKRMEEELRASEARYRSLYHSIRDALLVTDAERNITDCNAAFTQLFGYPLDEIKGKKTRYVYENEEEFKQLGTAIQDHIGDPQFLMTVNYQKKSGEVFPGETNVFYLRDEDDKIQGFIGLIRDVTDRVRTEAALQWQADVDAALAEISQALLTRKSTEDISRLVLEHAQQLTSSAFGYVGHIDPETGYLICTTMTHEIWDVCEVEDKDIVFEQFGGLWGWVLDHKESLMTNAPPEDPRSSGTPEGHIAIERFVSAPAMIGDELVGQIALANPGRAYEERDLGLTERLANIYALAIQRARAERQLEAYSEQLEEMVRERTRALRDAQERLLRRKKLAMLGQLAGSISHELRGPLGTIKNSTYFLQLALEDVSPDVQETLEILNEEIARSEAIISSMLDFARTETPNRQPVNINGLVEEALPRVEMPGTIKVELDLDDALPAVAADPEQLLRVFENLIKNAVEAMPEGGQMRIESDAILDEDDEPDRVELVFSDTGVGIREEDLAKIFEPLFSTKESGTGLGLALVQALVDAHGGSVEIETQVGEGSTFTVILPIDEEEM